MQLLIDIIFHLDEVLRTCAQNYGNWIYAIIFLIVFCETGLVIFPFLPGDSMLVALGSLTALSGSPLTIFNISVVLILAAFLGDSCNYMIGRKVGKSLAEHGGSRFIKKSHLDRTQEFYDKYGTRAVIMARFVPIVRTFAPFVSGVAKMPLKRFLGYSLVGSLLWTQVCLWAGAFLGNIPAVKQHFELVIIAVVTISTGPGAISWLLQRRKSHT